MEHTHGSNDFSTIDATNNNVAANLNGDLVTTNTNVTTINVVSTVVLPMMSYEKLFPIFQKLRFLVAKISSIGKSKFSQSLICMALLLL